jgi:hypothetical protein
MLQDKEQKEAASRAPAVCLAHGRIGNQRVWCADVWCVAMLTTLFCTDCLMAVAHTQHRHPYTTKPVFAHSHVPTPSARPGERPCGSDYLPCVQQMFFSITQPSTCAGPQVSQPLLADQQHGQPHLSICLLHIQPTRRHRTAANSHTRLLTPLTTAAAAAVAAATPGCCYSRCYSRLETQACCLLLLLLVWVWLRAQSAAATAAAAAGGVEPCQVWHRAAGCDPLLLCWLAQCMVQLPKLLQQLPSSSSSPNRPCRLRFSRLLGALQALLGSRGCCCCCCCGCCGAVVVWRPPWGGEVLQVAA